MNNCKGGIGMKKILSLAICCIFIFSLCACEKMDPDYGKSSAKRDISGDNESKTSVNSVVIPEIKSDDEVMPTYLDISLYDEENYADIYLGKNFEYKITYGGSTLNVPTTYKDMQKEGWSLVESDEYNEDSQIFAGKSLQVDFVNQYGNRITAVFYNSKKSSTSLKKCSLVKFIVAENKLINTKSDYALFWINGVSNESAVTDVVEYLGSPSHFYKVSENKYYLEWFINKNDRRSRITVYVDIAEDYIDSIEFSYY